MDKLPVIYNYTLADSAATARTVFIHTDMDTDIEVKSQTLHQCDMD